MCGTCFFGSGTLDPKNTNRSWTSQQFWNWSLHIFFTFLILLIFLKFYVNVRYLWFYIMAVSDEKFFLTPLVWECYALWTQTFLTLSLDYWQRELEYASTLRNTQGDHATPKLKLLNLVLICFPKTLQLRDNIFSTFFSSYNFFFMST